MKKNKGFTLIELMIVVAIVGILAAVAIPKFQELMHPRAKDSNGNRYNYIVTQYSQDGKVLDEYKAFSYYTTEGGIAKVTLADGTTVAISGSYKIQEVKKQK